jgi:hypothetical protein
LLGGYSNYVSGDFSAIVAGDDNTVNGDDSFIGGGTTNSITGSYSTISGGSSNTVSSSAQYATIAGGQSNSVSSNHGIAIGKSNNVSATYGIALGNTNTVTGTQGVAIGYLNSAGSNGMALGNNSTASADQFYAKYSSGFYFKGQGTGANAESKFTATFINDAAGGGNGINIILDVAQPNNANDFVRFTNTSGITVGRIEGQTIASKSDNAAQLSTSDNYVRELALYKYLLEAAEGGENAAERTRNIGIAKSVLAAVDVVAAWIEVGAGYACGSSPFTLNCAGMGPAFTAAAVSSVAQLGAMIADIVDYTANYREAQENLSEAQKLKADWACNLYSNAGVTYESGSADYAEWLPKSSLNDKFVASDIVGVKNGKISKNTSDVDQCMVISMKPIVLGNTPDAGKEKEYEKVAFMGQVPVKVLGKVELGDYIIPSGSNNGLGMARKPKDLSPYEYRKVIGVAWSAGDSQSGINIINVAVGLNQNSTSNVIEEQTDRIVLIEKELDDAQKEIKNINNVLVSLIPKYKEVRGLETNGTLQELFKGLDFDKAKQVSARKLKSLKPMEGIVAEKAATIPPDINVVPFEELERGYLQSRQQFIDGGGDIESHPFYSKMESDPVYREIMLRNMNRVLNKATLDASKK